MINPNKFDYNESFYLQNVSYSSKLFYDAYNRGISNNITLWNLTNVTSGNVDDYYYNFLYDNCLHAAFNVEEYANANLNISDDWVVHPVDTIDGGSCSNLVKFGVY